VKGLKSIVSGAMASPGIERGAQGLSVAKNSKQGAQKLAKGDLVSAVTVGIFKRSHDFFMALKRKAPHLWRKSGFEYVRECTGLISGTSEKHIYRTTAIPEQDTAGKKMKPPGPVTIKITPTVKCRAAFYVHIKLAVLVHTILPQVHFHPRKLVRKIPPYRYTDQFSKTVILSSVGLDMSNQNT